MEEAKTAKIYWNCFGLICRQEQWSRVHRSPTDEVNKLLNIGYHYLFDSIEKVLIEHELDICIGIGHGDSSMQPLIYDVVEIWRHIVDSIILRHFSRHRNQVLSIGTLINAIKREFESVYVYGNRALSLQSILHMEVKKLRDCILASEMYIPWAYHWGHNKNMYINE